MANATYVVVVEAGHKSWTIGPYHVRNKAESAIAALPPDLHINAWIEPVIRPDEYLQAIEQAFEDDAEHDFEKRTGA